MHTTWIKVMVHLKKYDVKAVSRTVITAYYRLFISAEIRWISMDLLFLPVPIIWMRLIMIRFIKT